MAVYKRGCTYWYEFFFRGERVRESTRQRNQNVARQMDAAHRTSLTAAIETVCADKPATITFY